MAGMHDAAWYAAPPAAAFVSEITPFCPTKPFEHSSGVHDNRPNGLVSARRHKGYDAAAIHQRSAAFAARGSRLAARA
ncbi:hypothetical protein BTO02_27640 [Paraburkholderia sp. SOS3]|nr:hypothetical protein BTO02_27640 [Paraburkholderia sp. SOS3]